MTAESITNPTRTARLDPRLLRVRSKVKPPNAVQPITKTKSWNASRASLNGKRMFHHSHVPEANALAAASARKAGRQTATRKCAIERAGLSTWGSTGSVERLLALYSIPGTERLFDGHETTAVGNGGMIPAFTYQPNSSVASKRCCVPG